MKINDDWFWIIVALALSMGALIAIILAILILS